MRTVAVNVYTFDELKPEVQNKVIDAYRNINICNNDWWDGVYEHWYEELKKHGFMHCKISFSGFGSQGDGACFDCDDFDIEKLIARGYNPVETEVLWVVVESVIISTINHHYSHHNTRKFEVYCKESGDVQRLLDTKPEDLLLFKLDELEHGEELKPLYEVLIKHPTLERPTVDGLVTRFQQDIEECRIDLCKKIYAALEEEYSREISDDAVRECLIANGMEFTEDGDTW
ncbi:MAG: hypothetical protein QW828_03825 [Candidatus Bathyarchaeia archaeon]